MGNFEKLSVLVIVVIIVMILVVALYTWTDKPKDAQEELASGAPNVEVVPPDSDVRSPEPDWPSGPSIFDEEDEQEGGAKSKTDDSEPPITPPPDIDPPPIVPDPATPIEPVVKEEAGPWEYTIQPGDTISQVCEREIGSWRRQKEVMDLNPGLDPLTIRAGQIIKMPPRKSSAPVGPRTSSIKETAGAASGPVVPGEWYVVKHGDRLSSIAKRAYGSIDRWPELWARNLSVVRDPDDLDGGERIYIPK